MLNELKWITCDENCVELAQQAWKECIPRIIKQAKLEKGSKVTQAVSILLDDDKGHSKKLYYYFFSFQIKETVLLHYVCWHIFFQIAEQNQMQIKLFSLPMYVLG